jgi:riboflavin synthase
MNKFGFHRNKYLAASAAAWIGCFALPQISVHVVGTGVLLYNVMERTGIIQAELHPDMPERKKKLQQ